MTNQKSYKQLKTELDDLLTSFESAEHDDVEAMLKDYDEATKVINQLEDMLKKAQSKLEDK